MNVPFARRCFPFGKRGFFRQWPSAHHSTDFFYFYSFRELNFHRKSTASSEFFLVLPPSYEKFNNSILKRQNWMKHNTPAINFCIKVDFSCTHLFFDFGTFTLILHILRNQLIEMKHYAGVSERKKQRGNRMRINEKSYFNFHANILLLNMTKPSYYAVTHNAAPARKVAKPAY